MLRLVKSVLLITDQKSLKNEYKKLTDFYRIKLTVLKEWRDIHSEAVIIEEYLLKQVPFAKRPRCVVVLRDKDIDANLYCKGFIFNLNDKRELIYSIMQNKQSLAVLDMQAQEATKEMLASLPSPVFNKGDYFFDFGNQKFMYKGEEIYLSFCQQRFIAFWLLKGNRVNKERALLYRLRLKYGRQFLADVGKNGGLI